MRFTVPQFIEHEAKVVGPFTFKQFIFIGIAGAICFFLYFTIPFQFFLIAAIVLILGALAFAFLKIGGRSLPAILANFLKFSLSPKIYLWKKKEFPPKIIKKEKPKIKEIEEGPLLRIAEKSRLKKLSTQIETKTR